MTDDPLLALLDAVVCSHGRLARATVVVRASKLPLGAKVWTDDDLREVVRAIERTSGLRRRTAAGSGRCARRLGWPSGGSRPWSGSASTGATA